MKYKISKHCLRQIKLRGISEEEVKNVLNNPDFIQKQDDEIIVYQSLNKDKMFLYRVFINTSQIPNLVVTAYKTSKIRKYYENKI